MPTAEEAANTPPHICFLLLAGVATPFYLLSILSAHSDPSSWLQRVRLDDSTHDPITLDPLSDALRTNTANSILSETLDGMHIRSGSLCLEADARVRDVNVPVVWVSVLY